MRPAAGCRCPSAATTAVAAATLAAAPASAQPATIARSRGEAASDRNAARSCSIRTGSDIRREKMPTAQAPPTIAAIANSGQSGRTPPALPIAINAPSQTTRVTPTAAAAPLTVQQPPFVTRPKSATRSAEPTWAGAIALTPHPTAYRADGVDERQRRAARAECRPPRQSAADARPAKAMPAAQSSPGSAAPSPSTASLTRLPNSDGLKQSTARSNREIPAIATCRFVR